MSREEYWERAEEGDPLWFLSTCVMTNRDILATRRKALIQPYPPDANAVSYSKQCYRAAVIDLALAAQEKKKGDLSDSKRLAELLNEAERSIERYKLVGRNPLLLGAMELFRLIIQTERFHLSVSEAHYEEALFFLPQVLNDAYDMLFQSETEDPKHKLAHQYLRYPFQRPSMGTLDGQLAQEAVNCFERLRSQPSTVKDWKIIAQICWALTDEELWTLCESKSTFPWLEDVPWHGEVTDSNGTLWPICEYWSFAHGFALSRLSPDQWRDWKEEEEREHAKRHMETLFFPGSWKQLSEGVRDTLIQADIVWWSRERSTRSTVIDNLWKATVEMVRETAWNPFVEYVRAHPGEELLWLKLDELQKRPSWEPSLGDFLHLMFQQPCLDAFLLSRQFPKDHRDFLESIEKRLGKLNTLRRKSVHPRKGEVIEANDVPWAYRTFLGIGCEGILPRLARIQLKG